MVPVKEPAETDMARLHRTISNFFMFYAFLFFCKGMIFVAEIITVARKSRKPDEMGKRFIQHGAMSYYNCWSELQTLADELLASTTQPESKKTKTPQA